MADTQAADFLQQVSSTSLGGSSPPRHLRRSALPELLPQVGNTIVSGAVQLTPTAPRSEKVVETRASFKVLESWVAKVDSVDNEAGAFTAIVASDKFPDTREVAEFSFDEISDDDRGLIVPGAIFYWSVGYSINDYGGRSTASVVRFRRVHHWKPKEIHAAKVRAAQYADWFLGEGVIASADGA